MSEYITVNQQNSNTNQIHVFVCSYQIVDQFGTHHVFGKVVIGIMFIIWFSNAIGTTFTATTSQTIKTRPHVS